MQTNLNNQELHPLIRPVNEVVTAVTLGAASLLLWGVLFPMTLFATLS